MRLRSWKDKSPQMAKQLFTFVDFDLKAVVHFERRFRRGVPRHIRWDQIVSPRSCKKIVENQKQSGAGYTPQKCESKSKISKYMYNYPKILFVQREQSAAYRPECDICMDFDTNEYLNIFV